MDEDKYITIDVSSLVDNTVDLGTIEVSTIGAGTVWLNTSENKYYVNDGVTWNLSNDAWTIKEWEDCFPDYNQVTEMCKEYPALEKAYENFKTIYKMVEQDWKGKTKDDPPF